MHLDCFKVGITISYKQQPQQKLSLICWAFNRKKSLVNELSGVCPVRWGGGGCRCYLRFMIQVRQVQKWQLAQNGKSADFTSSGLGSSAYTLINYLATLTQIIFIFSLQPQLTFIGMRVMRPLRKEISSMLFIFIPKELKWTTMRKNWRPNCTTTGLLHILNLVR